MAQKFFSNVNFVDSVDVSWGTDEDFTIYHISGDNYITNDIGDFKMTMVPEELRRISFWMDQTILQYQISILDLLIMPAFYLVVVLMLS